MVDTPAWGAGDRKIVQVRVLLPAPRASGQCQERTSKPAEEISLARSLELNALQAQLLKWASCQN